MRMKWCHVSALLLTVLLILSGCGKRGSSTDESSDPVPVSAEKIAGIRSALVRGMQPIGLGNLKPSDVGTECVVETQTPEDGLQVEPPPPPPGMVQGVGHVTFYRGQLDSVSTDSVTVRKAYPTSGNVKKIEIAKGQIRSIHMAP